MAFGYVRTTTNEIQSVTVLIFLSSTIEQYAVNKDPHNGLIGLFKTHTHTYTHTHSLYSDTVSKINYLILKRGNNVTSCRISEQMPTSW